MNGISLKYEILGHSTKQDQISNNKMETFTR